ncbi:hypothetical protein C7R93_05250 [Brevibacillus fortis]|uniref:Aspartyl-phosphate phosphatase Spo0E family protein n=2 Tax=Brevibacillus fortis TaxID=2126352 RepID=A0A2P7VIN8_9BACL|nr:hypothetical protein C7R93_05250 [Brevibacillus fortis]
MIKNLQHQLNEVFLQQGNLTDYAVVKVSQKLDEYILESQRRKLHYQKGEEENKTRTLHSASRQQERPKKAKDTLLKTSVTFR